MNDDVTKGHTVRRYDQELSDLRGLVLEMGECALDQVRNAVVAVTTGDVDLARRVVDRERRVDYFELDADEAIFNLIAKRQPAAIDLRLILALSKVIGDLERTGDKATQIAWCTIRMMEREGQQPCPKLFHHVHSLQEISCTMMDRALEALAKADMDAVADVFARGKRLEDEFDAGLRHLMTFVLQDVTLVGQVLDMVFALRALERVGDHATSIAEQVVFVAKARDVRYQNKEILIEALRDHRAR